MSRSTRHRPPPRRPTRRRGPNPFVVGGVIAVVIAAVALGLLVAGGSDGGGTSSQVGRVEVEGAALVALPDTGPDPAIGARPPALLATNPDGSAVTLSPGQEPMLVAFLAHWCEHCQRELPRLVELQREGAFEGMRTVAVLTATSRDRPNYPPDAWLDREGWTGDRLFDTATGTAAQAFGLSGFPFLVFVDGDGQVVARLSGEQEKATLRDLATQAKG